jgi:hypothetical protein
MSQSPFQSNGARAIDLLKAESAINVPVRHVMRFPSGKELPIFVTPITLAQRKAAAKNAGSEDDQLSINLQLLVAKAKDENGQPLFSIADLPDLRNQCDAGLVAELIGQIYAGRETGEDEDDTKAPDFAPKLSSRASAKIPD